MRKFWRIDELARFFDVSEKTVRRLIKKGLLPATRIGKQLRVSDDDLQAFLKSATTTHKQIKEGKRKKGSRTA